MRFDPIIPFEPVSSATIPEGKQWVAQIKWDGVRILTYYDGEQVRLFNRKKNERTMQYPEIITIESYCRSRSVILDGEMIALGEDGKPAFSEIMRRDAVRRPDRVHGLQREIPVTYMVFDVIYCDGKWLDHARFQERMEELERIIIPNEHVQRVPIHPDPKALYSVIHEQQMEGIVVKELNSPYVIGGKNHYWKKVKVYHDLIAVIGGVTFRGDQVNSILLGLYDQLGQLWYIGHAGTGKLTQKDWQQFTQFVREKLIIEHCPFIRIPERIQDTVWTRPLCTVKIRFLEWTSAQTLRQPIIQAFVVAKPEECTFVSNGIHTVPDSHLG